MLLRLSAGLQQVLAGSHLVSCEVQTYGLLVVLQVLDGAHVVSLEVQTFGLLVARIARLRREVVGAWSLVGVSVAA